MEFSFNGKITLNDYIQFCNFFIKKYNIIILSVICTIIIINFAIQIKDYSDYMIIHNSSISELKTLAEEKNLTVNGLFDNNIIFVVSFFISEILLVLFFGILIIIYKIVLKKYFKKYFSTNKIYTEDINYLILDDLIKIESKSEKLILTKQNIYKILYDEDSIYIFIGFGNAYIVKKHFFNDEGYYNELLVFVKEKYKN